MTKCETCSEKIINHKYLIQESGIAGIYFDYKFCSKKCFVLWIIKKFKKMIAKNWSG